MTDAMLQELRERGNEHVEAGEAMQAAAKEIARVRCEVAEQQRKIQCLQQERDHKQLTIDSLRTQVASQDDGEDSAGEPEPEPYDVISPDDARAVIVLDWLSENFVVGSMITWTELASQIVAYQVAGINFVDTANTAVANLMRAGYVKVHYDSYTQCFSVIINQVR